uniref:Uncharacterized protein n=1 Tax=Micrurus paraensis TaxID=1970185 RepID=A0A2D4KUX8_9SAUR
MVLIGLSLFQNLAWEGNEPFLGVQFSALLALWVLRSVESEVLCFSFPPHSTALCRGYMQIHYRISCSAGKRTFDLSLKKMMCHQVFFTVHSKSLESFWLVAELNAFFP